MKLTVHFQSQRIASRTQKCRYTTLVLEPRYTNASPGEFRGPLPQVNSGALTLILVATTQTLKLTTHSLALSHQLESPYIVDKVSGKSEVEDEPPERMCSTY